MKVQHTKEGPINKGLFLRLKNKTKLSHLFIDNKTFLSYNKPMFKQGDAP